MPVFTPQPHSITTSIRLALISFPTELPWASDYKTVSIPVITGPDAE